jgi:arylsulfatase A-like enzyme
MRPEEPAPEPGNVLVLIADDLGVDQLAAYGLGSDLPPTPNLDRMAAEGVLFRNVWSQPVCSPTRATIQTGRYGFRTTIGATINVFGGGPALPLDELTLPEMLDLGTGGRYAHAMIGKWHLGTSQVGGDLAPNLAGYGHFSGSMEGQITNYFGWRKVSDGVVSMSHHYATSACVDDALQWIGQQTGPWLCVVGFQAPHAPFHVPPAHLHTQVLPPVIPPDSCATAGSTDPRPFYKAMIQALDTEIGRLLAGLPAGMRARTTIFFLGDNGSEPCVRVPSLPAPAKATLYEGGVAVPFLASGYGVGRGESRALVNTCDLFATIAELSGIDPEKTLPGLVLDSVSFASSLRDPAREQREWLYAETFGANGPGQPPVLPACPTVPVCQQDIGFDGPGGIALASCGPPLYGAYGSNLVPWQVSGGPPPAFDATIGAWLISSPPACVIPFRLDGKGAFAGTLWTGNTSREIHYQVVAEDPALPLGFTVSSALRMDLLPTYMRAVRNRRYKLIRLDPCTEQMYDLGTDPLELTDLLRQPLTTDESAAYFELSARLGALH